MKRQIIHIDQEKCNGCGACAAACHEGAIAMVGGKATLMRDDYCDGMGDCLPHCPTGAIVGAGLSPAASAGGRALAMLPGQTCIVLGALPGQLWGAWAALCALAAWAGASV